MGQRLSQVQKVASFKFLRGRPSQSIKHPRISRPPFQCFWPEHKGCEDCLGISVFPWRVVHERAAFRYDPSRLQQQDVFKIRESVDKNHNKTDLSVTRLPYGVREPKRTTVTGTIPSTPFCQTGRADCCSRGQEGEEETTSQRATIDCDSNDNNFVIGIATAAHNGDRYWDNCSNDISLIKCRYCSSDCAFFNKSNSSSKCQFVNSYHDNDTWWSNDDNNCSNGFRSPPPTSRAANVQFDWESTKQTTFTAELSTTTWPAVSTA